jgi:DNA-binding winged helix-turn-helix (wHTH) protein
MRIRFDNCLIDTDTRQVLRDGHEALLSPKAYRLLMLLVEARPKAVAKEVLYQSLWPDTFVVEANLSNLVGEIRAALGDSAHHPRFIRTLHGFGYAFSGEAVITRTEGPPPIGPAPPRRIEGAVLGYLIKGDGQALPLRGRETVVGRAPDAQVRLDLPGISRRHARITITEDRAVVEDLQSKNGTFVRGERIAEPRTAMSGDELGFGSVRVALHIASPDRSTETTL